MNLKACVLFILLFSLKLPAQSKVYVAVASNFLPVFKKIAEEFKNEKKQNIEISSGSTGSLYAQIANNAPFEIFLSADQQTVAKLISEQLAVADTRWTYAQGKLVLLSSEKNKVVNELSLQDKNLRKIALANPRLAPYGRAAQQVLEKMGLWNQLQPKIVLGENIGQSYQFVVSKNTDLGFVAWSQLKADSEIKGKNYWLVPDTYYQPLLQDGILLKKGEKNKLAWEFINYLKTDKVKKIIAQFGYGI